MSAAISDVINLAMCPIGDSVFQDECARTLSDDGVLVLPQFLLPEAVAVVREEAEKQQHLAYYTSDDHNIYLTPADPAYAVSHVRNRLVSSSKGCITDDQIPQTSALRRMYDSTEFRAFLSAVLDEAELHAYADPLSSINVHYASDGQELGWHFDNSSFAITLMIQKPDAGGEFEYVRDVRNADAGEMNFEESAKVLDDETKTHTLSMEPGTLVMFRGRNSMHRVTPVIGARTRMLVVFAYNTKPDVSLSESARLTFFGRVG